MNYRITISPDAEKDIVILAKTDHKAFLKVQKLIGELREHPTTGTGHPEPLKGQPEGRWSRRITKKHRLVYQIFQEEIVVLVLSAWGHYNDK
ncbi:MAG: Txe/YoeB family addiction module toxin [Muribaculaceae bacterium]|nr:Txe/YoeB family addiction module toxin [Muribaculaceae bacterium]